MPDLNHLKISKIPAAFAEVAEKHNELVQLIASIEAATGIDIKMVSSAPKKLKVPGTASFISKQPRGRIRIGIRPQVNGQSQGAAPINELHFRYNVGNSTITAFDVDATNGSLLTDYTSAPTITRYAQFTNLGVIRAYDDTGTNTVNINSVGMSAAFDSGPNSTSIAMNVAGFKVTNEDTGDYVKLGADGEIKIYNSANNKSLTVQIASITQNMGVKTINVCDNSNTRSMLIIASDPF